MRARARRTTDETEGAFDPHSPCRLRERSSVGSGLCRCAVGDGDTGDHRHLCRDGRVSASSESGNTVPVMVTYMRNSRRPGDDVETKLSKSRLRDGFARDGEFNIIWRPKGIELALIGFRACSYELGSNWERDPPRSDVPKPDVKDAFDDVFLRVLRDHNTRTIKRRRSSALAFRGLDLYLWWDIAAYPGFGVRARFGRAEEVLGRGERGAVVGPAWGCLDGHRLRGPEELPGCPGSRSGHFFGLCHCCHGANDVPQCINALRPEYCPGLGFAAAAPISCSVDDLQKRLMSATNPHDSPLRRELADCEVKTAREGARRVLKIGANGLPNTNRR